MLNNDFYYDWLLYLARVSGRKRLVNQRDLGIARQACARCREGTGGKEGTVQGHD